MSIKCRRVFSALTTKFDQHDNLDFALFERNLDAQLDAGVAGIILNGTLGESNVLSTNEKERLVKFAIEKLAGKVLPSPKYLLRIKC